MTASQPAENLIGVTGATGYIGGNVANLLAQRQQKQRLIVRDPNRAPQITSAEIVQISESGYRDKASMTTALRDVHTLFLVSGHLSDDRVKDHTTAVDSALSAGVKRIVYLSFLNAAPDATFVAAREHFQTEEYIRACDVAFTFLRAGLYADLVPLRFNAEAATLRGPAGDGRISYVLRDDIVDLAAIVLTTTGHDGKTYNMTGSQAFTLAEVAAMLTDLTGRKCTYYDETLEEARQSRAVYNVSDEIVETWISNYTAIANDEMSLISDDIARITGRPARTLRDFLNQHPESYQHLIVG
jgi:uncharacterized protein YbjT (DUF2867 family)